MAFDTTTRGRLAKFVGEARRLLADEFVDQLQSRYGISPTGNIAPIEGLGHLDAEGRELAATLRQRIAYLESSHAEGRDATQAAVSRLTREQAFTVLNRLAAIRMAEKRGLIVESVGQQYQSKGFKVFESVAGSAIGETFDRYRCYLFCLFDELAIDLGVLFDRKSPQAMLFPREPALLALLDLLDSPDLQELWAEDETIGWIYQYYNDEAERKKMREESAAPRNSRELAVRNQFFTPRYVVEFLTDNTLGRIWCEMRQGETSLRDRCRYLVRRPNEIFLKPGEEGPAEAAGDGTGGAESLSQEDLLRQPVHIPFRPLKDPREIRLLDPACGSMHFGLYAFDLFLVIYEEAWNIAAAADAASSVEAFATFVAYASEFPNKDAFLREVPRLIVECNLHGIDIDPRAAQIAGLSLWLRAQRAWHDAGIKPLDRPRITRSHIVCAEPMPGDTRLLEEFVEQQFPEGERPAFAFLLDTVFARMALAGEAGSLLRIEDEIRTAVVEAKKLWQKESAHEQSLLFKDLVDKPDAVRKRLDLSGITDEQFWEGAEQRIYEALELYADLAETARGVQRRLFADDAAHGLAFIGLCRKRYDVTVMNPPFGENPLSLRALLDTQYGSATLDIFDLFYRRAFAMTLPRGTVGAITPRTMLYQGRFTDLRKHFFGTGCRLDVVAELDLGVLDAATVRPALFVISQESSYPYRCLYFDLLHAGNPDDVLLNGILEHRRGCLAAIQTFHSIDRFETFPDSRLSLWAGPSVLELFNGSFNLEPFFGKVTQGLSCDDDNRFLRCWWEVPQSSSTWVPFGKFDARSTFVSDFSIVIDWSPATYALLGSISNRRANEDLYFNAGIAFTRSCEVGMAATVLPPGLVFSTVSRYFLPAEISVFGALAFLNTKLAEGLHLVLTPDRDRVSGTLRRVPMFMARGDLAALEGDAHAIWASKMTLLTTDETHRLFSSSTRLYRRMAKLSDLEGFALTLRDDVHAIEQKLELAVASHCPATSVDIRGLYERVRPREGEHDLVTWAKDIATNRAAAVNTLSEALGCAFGRWDVRRIVDSSKTEDALEPFAPLPSHPPGMLIGDDRLPMTVEQGRTARFASTYPIEVAWDGILVDDSEHPLDLMRQLQAILVLLLPERFDTLEEECCRLLQVPSWSEWFRRPTAFFGEHLKRYTKSRRQAPIYWPLSTRTGSYTLWIYCHRLSGQTLHKCLADFVNPKIRKVETELASLAGKADRRFAQCLEFLNELQDLRDEIERVIKLPWKPNLNDGVLITACPLWKLFRLPKWQKDLKSCWEELERGDYDWSHLAYTIWPERVEKACETDRSIAIAHGLEHLCKAEPTKAKRGRGKKATS